MRYGDPAVNYFNRQYSYLFANESLETPLWAGLVETLLYYSPDGGPGDLAALPPAQLYSSIHVGAFCGGAAPWAVGVPDATTPGSSLHFKGGDTAFGHGHLEYVGSLRDCALNTASRTEPPQPSSHCSRFSLHRPHARTCHSPAACSFGTWVFDLRGVRVIEDLAADN